MAVWCIPRSPEMESAAEAHFNYWRISGDEDFRRLASYEVSDFLEIGVMLDDPSKIDRVCIYIPQTVDPKSVTDCSEHFSRPSIAQGIFNEVLSASASGRPGPRYIELRKGPEVFCRVYRFLNNGSQLDASELAVGSYAEGTLLTITRHAVDQTYTPETLAIPTYFRIRIRVGRAKDSAFVRTVPTPDRLLQSGYDEVEYIDFRLNEARTLPEQIEAMMRADQANVGIKLRLVAFLTAVPVQSELSVSNPQSHKLRLLEHELWNDYVPGGIPEGMMVYHWKRDAPQGLSDFSAFVRLQTRRTGRSTLLKYLAIAFLFGVFGNLCASALEWTWGAVRDVGEPCPTRTMQSTAGETPMSGRVTR